MSYRIGFFMDQIAGHITKYHNLRSVVQQDPTIEADWHELFYYKAGGAIEKIHEQLLPFVPSYFSGNLRATVDMRRSARSGQYDAFYSNASVGVFFSGTFRKTPTLIDFDSTPRQMDRMESYTARRDPKPLELLKFSLFRSMLHAASLLQAWSRWAKRSAIEEYGVPEDRVVVNPPGVDLRYWQPGSAIHRAYELHRPLRVLFVGGDFRRKGGELLLDWYRTHAPDRCELHVVTREPVEPRPGLRVYHSMQPNSPELRQLYQQSDLFVLPSFGECFGIATIEAMAAGLPVIASDVGGTADIIEPGRNGYIIPAGSVTDLSAAIDAIARDPVQRFHMANQSRQMAEERFDLEINARRTLSYLKQIARVSTSHKVPAKIIRSV